MEDDKILPEINLFEKEYNLKGKDNRIIQLIIKNEFNLFIFECKIDDILYKNKFSLKDFYNSNSLYACFTDEVFFFKSYLSRLSEEEIEIEIEKDKVKVVFIIESKNTKSKAEFVLELEKPKNEGINVLQPINLYNLFKSGLIGNFNKIYTEESDIGLINNIICRIIENNINIYLPVYMEGSNSNEKESEKENICYRLLLMKKVIDFFEFLFNVYKLKNNNIIGKFEDLNLLYNNLIKRLDNKNEDMLKDISKLCFVYGKIFEKNGKNYVLLNEFGKIIFIYDEEGIIMQKDENTFLFLSFLELIKYDNDYIYYKTNENTRKYTEEESEEINNKILVKLYSVDYENYIDTIFNTIFIDCSEKITKYINQKIIYFSFTETKYTQDYFPQKLELISNQKKYQFSIFLMKGYCNEINLFVNLYGGYAYEYYFISKNYDYLPKFYEIQLKDNLKYKFNNLWNYECSNRKKITFVNIPKQDGIERTISNKSSFLKIYTCEEYKNIEYGTFLLDNLNVYTKEKIIIDEDVVEFIDEIIIDVKNYINNKKDMKYIYDKYINKLDRTIIDEINKDYILYYFPDDRDFFNTFSKLCVLYILYHSYEKKWKKLLSNYFDILEKIKYSQLNYSDKGYLLNCVVRNSFDRRLNIFPKINFFNKENIDKDAYTKAYYFHLDLIDNLNEDSKLMIPFLQLNSYIMDKILTEEEKEKIKNIKKDNIQDKYKYKKYKDNIKNIKLQKIEEENLDIKPAYTISMIPCHIIKKHLKQTMCPYCLIFGIHSKRTFFACVRKENNVICFNEDRIVSDFYLENNNNDIYNTVYYQPENIDDYAFIINILFIHENSSHNKEKLLNLNIESPVIYLNENFIRDFMLLDDNLERGEAGFFVENFIAEPKIMDKLIDPQNKLGKLLKVEYFIENNFDKLLEKFNSLTEKYEKNSSVDYNNALSNNKEELSKEKNSDLYIRLNRKYLMKEACEKNCNY